MRADFIWHSVDFNEQKLIGLYQFDLRTLSLIVPDAKENHQTYEKIHNDVLIPI